jgi:hypothetical protein
MYIFIHVCSAYKYTVNALSVSLSSQTKQTIEKLQNIVSSDGRFRNLRDALHRCDPPCIPYLGMYLTDLSFIEEGTPNFTEDGLLNFSKMRMVRRMVILFGAAIEFLTILTLVSDVFLPIAGSIHESPFYTALCFILELCNFSTS